MRERSHQKDPLYPWSPLYVLLPEKTDGETGVIKRGVVGTSGRTDIRAFGSLKCVELTLFMVQSALESRLDVFTLWHLTSSMTVCRFTIIISLILIKEKLNSFKKKYLRLRKVNLHVLTVSDILYILFHPIISEFHTSVLGCTNTISLVTKFLECEDVRDLLSLPKDPHSLSVVYVQVRRVLKYTYSRYNNLLESSLSY